MYDSIDESCRNDCAESALVWRPRVSLSGIITIAMNEMIEPFIKHTWFHQRQAGASRARSGMLRGTAVDTLLKPFFWYRLTRHTSYPLCLREALWTILTA